MAATSVLLSCFVHSDKCKEQPPACSFSKYFSISSCNKLSTAQLHAKLMSYAVHKLLLMHILVAYFPFLFYFYPIFFLLLLLLLFLPDTSKFVSWLKLKVLCQPASTGVPLDYKLFISCPKANWICSCCCQFCCRSFFSTPQSVLSSSSDRKKYIHMGKKTIKQHKCMILSVLEQTKAEHCQQN